MAEQIVELAPSESKLVSFEAVPQKAKVYQVSVNGLSGSFIATEVPVAKGVITLYATGLRTFYWPGGYRMEGTPYEQYIPPGVYADWDAEWYYPGGWRYNMDEYYWAITQNDPCTPPEPIDLNNLLIKVHDYWSDEICPATGYGGACEWGPFGPFVVEDGGVYTIDIRTGELIEGRV